MSFNRFIVIDIVIEIIDGKFKLNLDTIFFETVFGTRKYTV